MKYYSALRVAAVALSGFLVSCTYAENKISDQLDQKIGSQLPQTNGRRVRVNNDGLNCEIKTSDGSDACARRRLVSSNAIEDQGRVVTRQQTGVHRDAFDDFNRDWNEAFGTPQPVLADTSDSDDDHSACSTLSPRCSDATSRAKSKIESMKSQVSGSGVATSYTIAYCASSTALDALHTCRREAAAAGNKACLRDFNTQIAETERKANEAQSGARRVGAYVSRSSCSSY